MPLLIGGALSFLFAILAIYVDCYQAIRKNIWCVPRQFWVSVPLGSLAGICGCIAVLAFWFASTTENPADSGWFDTLLGAKVPNLYLRGVYTGLAVLALIRGKIPTNKRCRCEAGILLQRRSIGLSSRDQVGLGKLEGWVH